MKNSTLPLIQALRSKAKPQESSTSQQSLLEFILAHYDLVPKDTENEDKKEEMVMTQESHIP